MSGDLTLPMIPVVVLVVCQLIEYAYQGIKWRRAR